VDPIELLHDARALDGTCFIELLPGKYRGECWGTSSLFLSEETWAYLEPTVRRHFPAYDHYAFMEIPNTTWTQIRADLARIARALDSAASLDDVPELGFFFVETRSEFEANFAVHVRQLSSLIAELDAWLRVQCSQHEVVSVLGI
jgi:hypothetical protein